MARGTLITIEGLDGAGKSTLAQGIVSACAERGRPVELLREPGGVTLSERLRAIVKDASLAIESHAEALIYAAARAQLVHERLRPAIEAGGLVLLDRFVDSSLAYQGAGRGLGVDEVRAVNAFATGALAPDRTLLLRLMPADAHARLAGRLAGRLAEESTAGGYGGAADGLDRLEREDESFFVAIAAAYDRLAEEEPERIRVLDATLTADRLLEEALGAIDDLL
jgi:dTMP kinase